MSQKVHCGRLVLNKDGTVKRLDLTNGGGIRDCILSHIDIGFDEIHDSLRDLYKLDPRNQNSKLYDFQLTELDTNRYRTFFEYVHKNGLKFRSTLLYLCTPADNENVFHPLSPEKNRTPIQNPVQTVRRIAQVEADSSTSPVLIKVDDDSSIHHKSITESSLNHRIVQNLRISSTTSFANYSFEQSLSEFIEYLHNLIKQYNHESIFIQLFEYICTLQGLSSITLDQLKQQIHPGNEHEKQFFNNALDKIEKLSRSIKATIELNKMKISNIDQHSIIIDSFNQFHRNFNILRDQWMNNRSNTSFSSTNRSSDPVPLMSISTTHHSVDPSPTGSFSSRNQSTSFSSTHHSIEPSPTVSFASRNHSTSRTAPTTYSSSSSRHHTENDSRKRSRALSPSTHRSHRSSTEQTHSNDKYSLFDNILKSLERLLNVLDDLRFTSFFDLLKKIMNDIRFCRSNIKLSEYHSIEHAKQLIISMETRLTNRINDEYHRASPHGIDRQLEYSFDKTLDAIKHLLNAFQYYQSQVNKTKRSRKTRWSPPDVEKEHIEHKPIMNSNQHQTELDDINDDQSSEASHSSFGDEVLMEVARDAYEQRPHQYK